MSKTLSTTALLNDPTWANVHFALATAVNPIPTGDTGTAQRSRMIIELSTHDEIRASYDVDLGYGPEMSLLTKKQYEIGCGGYDHSDRTGSVLLLPASGHSRVTCTLIQAKGNSITQPVYVLIENYDAIAANTKFNFFLAKVGNPLAGTAHLLIRVQSIQPDGSWYDIYSHPVGYMGDTYTPAPNGGLGLKSLLNANGHQMTQSQTRAAKVSFNQGYKTWKLPNSPVLTAGTLLQIEYSFPYESVDRMRCYQYQLPKYHSDTNLHPVLNGMCGAAAGQRIAAVWNVMDTFQPQL